MLEYWAPVNCCLVTSAERLLPGFTFGLMPDDGGCGMVSSFSAGGVGARGTTEPTTESKGCYSITKVLSTDYSF